MSDTKQPIWKKVGSVGDVNPLDCGGGFVYADETEVYPPEMEYIQSQDDGSGDAGPWLVYRVALDPPRFKTLTELGKQQMVRPLELPQSERGVTWHWYNEWFVKSLPDVAANMGTTAFSMLRWLLSKNPVLRAYAYLTLAEYHGWENFDAYPLIYTREQRGELAARTILKPLETL